MTNTLTLAKYLEAIRSKEISPAEVADAVAKQITTVNSALNIYVSENNEMKNDHK